MRSVRVIRASWVRHNEGAADGTVLKKIINKKIECPLKTKIKIRLFLGRSAFAWFSTFYKREQFSLIDAQSKLSGEGDAVWIKYL
jgi:hypothetical protein